MTQINTDDFSVCMDPDDKVAQLYAALKTAVGIVTIGTRATSMDGLQALMNLAGYIIANSPELSAEGTDDALVEHLTGLMKEVIKAERAGLLDVDDSAARH
jgi:hypothetical protein